MLLVCTDFWRFWCLSISVFCFFFFVLWHRSDVVNHGNTLYVTGLSTRVTERDLEDHFSKEGKVLILILIFFFLFIVSFSLYTWLPPTLLHYCWCFHVLQVASCFLVVEPRTRISRGFAFVTMDNVEDADRCIKYLNQSVLEGRYITVEKVKLYKLESWVAKVQQYWVVFFLFWLGGFLVIFRTHCCVSFIGSNQRWRVHPSQLLCETAWSMASLNSFSNACDQLNIATILPNNFTTSAFTFNSQLSTNQRTLPTTF